MASIREQIINALAEKWSPAAKTAPTVEDFADDDIIGITDETETATEEGFDQLMMTLSLRVEGIKKYVPDMTTRTQVANDLLANIKDTALGGDASLGGLIETIRYLEGETVYPNEDSLIVGAFARFELSYRHDYGDSSTNSELL